MPQLPPLTSVQRQQCRSMFESFDKYGYGKVSLTDLLTLTKTYYKDIYDTLNLDGTYPKDWIDLDDFFNIFRLMKLNSIQNSTQEPILELFVGMGGKEDKSGRISKRSFEKVLRDGFGLPINVEKLLREADEDRDGEVDFQEFKFLLQ